MKTNWFKNILLAAMVLALVAAALPWTSVFAAPAADPSTPPADGEESNTRIEALWTREQNAVERMGKVLDRSTTMTEKVQTWIDKAREDGKDVTALQAALDAYKQAVQAAGPMYEQAQSIVQKHAGFDADGKVTDREQAMQTLKDLGTQLKALREQVGTPGKALREAIKAFREANKPADSSSSN
jgi:uncharacterized protein YbaA (DUF1428 family)